MPSKHSVTPLPPRPPGVGYPQLSAVLECADAAHGLGGHIISDGGCTCPGDVAKAFGAGADFVMMGGMLAGHDQSGGEVRLVGVVVKMMMVMIMMMMMMMIDREI